MASTKEVLAALVDPWRFMYLSLSFLPGTLLRLLRARDFAVLASPSRLQAVWFGDFWAVAGPEVRAAGEAKVVPLLEGRVQGGKIVDHAAVGGGGGVAGLGGTVLDIGPGSGMWVSLFSDRYLGSTDAGTSPLRQRGSAGRTKVVKVLGIEPNAGVHGLLRKQVHDAGLDDVYEVVPLGIESLLTTGRVAPASVDCIVSVLCLCSIPDPAHNIKALYECLKPGGRWFVYEHVRYEKEKGWAMSLYQAFLNLLWPRLIGGCELCRDTGRHLHEAGPWTEIDLMQPPQEPWYFTLPHIYGTLTK